MGFQLSFAATLGLVRFASPLENLTARLAARILPNGLPAGVLRTISDVCLLTMAAPLAVWLRW